jgi:hypothetical protein
VNPAALSKFAAAATDAALTADGKKIGNLTFKVGRCRLTLANPS